MSFILLKSVFFVLLNIQYCLEKSRNHECLYMRLSFLPSKIPFLVQITNPLQLTQKLEQIVFTHHVSLFRLSNVPCLGKDRELQCQKARATTDGLPRRVNQVFHPRTPENIILKKKNLTYPNIKPAIKRNIFCMNFNASKLRSYYKTITGTQGETVNRYKPSLP